MIEPVELLARPDKWYLSAGDGVIFAPPFPVWLDAPGFWDEATVYQYSFAPLFTVTAIDTDEREVRMLPLSRRWTPADLTLEYELSNGMSAVEVRTVHPGGVFVSEWTLNGGASRAATVHLVAWTAQDVPLLDPVGVEWNGSITFSRIVQDRRNVPCTIKAELACAGGATSWCTRFSEHTANQPHWALTPFTELWTANGLPGSVRLPELPLANEGLAYAAVHKKVKVEADGASVVFAMRLAADVGRAQEVQRQEIESHGGTFEFVSRRRWQGLFERVPDFHCSDPYLERYYWYRWYGLFLNALAPGEGNYAYPSVCEGIGFFHQPISYSAQCHARELRWLADPEHARGIFRTFFFKQKPDGSLHGRIYLNHLSGTDFYHANWGDALLELDAVAPDTSFLREMYAPLSRYASWLAETRDAGESGMFDVIDQFETGQEYMSRYLAVDPDADRYGWENRLRLKGIDVTVYAYALFRALSKIAIRIGAADEDRWNAFAERTKRAVQTRMWDPIMEMFFDLNPATGARTGVKAAVCFYPYFTDLVDETHVAGLERHLLDRGEFWTSFPVPSSSLDDPLFDANAEWKGKRYVCPWNGRVWPMTNSHIVEALSFTAIRLAPRLRATAGGLLSRFVRMMFHDGDLARPNCYEHYNPFTGHASVYRGIDDYQHSWVADLIIKYVMGVRPHDGGVTVDPFPLGLEWAEVRGVRVRGSILDVRIDGQRIAVTVAGKTTHGRLGEAVEVTI
ncbi:MAG: hypothetical protein ABR543_09820 [Gemmatimonadaceae bacterium]